MPLFGTYILAYNNYVTPEKKEGRPEGYALFHGPPILANNVTDAVEFCRKHMHHLEVSHSPLKGKVLLDSIIDANRYADSPMVDACTCDPTEGQLFSTEYQALNYWDSVINKKQNYNVMVGPYIRANSIGQAEQYCSLQHPILRVTGRVKEVVIKQETILDATTFDQYSEAVVSSPSEPVDNCEMPPEPEQPAEPTPKLGAVVGLKSGGPPMTITNDDNEYDIEVSYFNGGELIQYILPRQAIHLLFV